MLDLAVYTAKVLTSAMCPAMMHRPSPGFRLWDTWIFPAEDEFHLYYLRRSMDRHWRGLGHAISTDLVHWEKCDPIPTVGPDGAWDSGGPYTGMVVSYGDQYAMTYGSAPDKIQRIGMMFSPDLYNWTKYPENPVLEACPPYKLKDDWRDAYMMKVDDGYEALICARMPDGQSCIARMRSNDLTHWDALQPIAAPSVSQCEVPEYFQMGDKHYLIFACNGRVDDRSRKDSAGTRYLISDARLGDYVMPEDSLLVGSGNGRLDCYVGRTFEMNGQRILYYHNCGPRPAVGAPKIIRQNPDGTLWTQYWDGLAGLETGVVIDGIGEGSQRGNGWKLDENRLLGHKDSGISAYMLSPVVSDFHLTCTINVEKGTRAAAIFRYDEQTQAGCALILNAKSGNIEIAKAEEGQATILDAMDLGLKPGEEHTLRIFARSEFADCYVNDRFIFSTVVNDAPLSGKIGFAVHSAAASFRNLRVASLEAE